MKNDDIERTKRQGAQAALFKAIQSFLWDAKNAAERAGHHNSSGGYQFENFDESIERARKALDDAQRFHDALITSPR